MKYKVGHLGESAFTVVELVVVSSIIGILSTIAIANYGLFKEQVSDSVAVTDYRNIKSAMYAEDADSDTAFYFIFNHLINNNFS